MNDTPALFLTWSTYGTWLPGDARGWTEYHRGWQLPDPILELESKAKMTEEACLLDKEQRSAVEQQISETCEHRGWHLHAVNCRSNHIHVVVLAADVKPKKVRIDLKAWATRCLKNLEAKRQSAQKQARSVIEDVPESSLTLRANVIRENWWTERGSIRFINDDDSLLAAIDYTLDAQGRKTNKLLDIRTTISPTRERDAEHKPSITHDPSLTHRAGVQIKPDALARTNTDRRPTDYEK